MDITGQQINKLFSIFLMAMRSKQMILNPFRDINIKITLQGSCINCVVFLIFLQSHKSKTEYILPYCCIIKSNRKKKYTN